MTHDGNKPGRAGTNIPCAVPVLDIDHAIQEIAFSSSICEASAHERTPNGPKIARQFGNPAKSFAHQPRSNAAKNYLVHAAHVVQEFILLGVIYGGGRLCEQAQHGLHLLLPVLALGDLRCCEIQDTNWRGVGPHVRRYAQPQSQYSRRKQTSHETTNHAHTAATSTP